MNDNDYSHTDTPYLGVLASQVPLGPLSFEGCFGGFDNQKFAFCETVNSDRTYEFSTVLTTTRQTEITVISDYDGPFNFVAGLYQFDQRNHNIYQVQTAAWNLTGAFANHPYSSAVYGGAFNGYGGIPFYATMVLGLQSDPTCASGALGPVAQAVPSTSNPACLGGLLAAGAALGAIPNGPYELPVQLRGYVNDDHVKTDSTALFGEMYFDLSEDTKLTIGLRYNDDEVYDSIMTCLSDQDCPNYTFDDYLAGEYQFKPTRITVADDAFAYKIALQHDLNDNQMVYASYSTAIKAGGNNPVIGTEPDPYDQEETGVFEIGTKGIFMDGGVLFNVAVFFN
jgi:outer membrane receptor protein involved in Fe transport